MMYDVFRQNKPTAVTVGTDPFAPHGATKCHNRAFAGAERTQCGFLFTFNSHRHLQAKTASRAGAERTHSMLLIFATLITALLASPTSAADAPRKPRNVLFVA